MKKITLETDYGVYSVQHNNTGDTINEVVEELVIPVLVAAGFHPETVKDEVEWQQSDGMLADKESSNQPILKNTQEEKVKDTREKMKKDWF